jgi:hypothetical protein
MLVVRYVDINLNLQKRYGRDRLRRRSGNERKNVLITVDGFIHVNLCLLKWAPRRDCPRKETQIVVVELFGL